MCVCVVRVACSFGILCVYWLWVFPPQVTHIPVVLQAWNIGCSGCGRLSPTYWKNTLLILLFLLWMCSTKGHNLTVHQRRFDLMQLLVALYTETQVHMLNSQSCAVDRSTAQISQLVCAICPEEMTLISSLNTVLLTWPWTERPQCSGDWVCSSGSLSSLHQYVNKF